MNILLSAHCSEHGTDDMLVVTFTFSSLHAVHYKTSLSHNEYKWALIIIFFVTHADLVLGTFILRLFSLTPLCPIYTSP